MLDGSPGFPYYRSRANQEERAALFIYTKQEADDIADMLTQAGWKIRHISTVTRFAPRGGTYKTYDIIVEHEDPGKLPYVIVEKEHVGAFTGVAG